MLLLIFNKKNIYNQLNWFKYSEVKDYKIVQVITLCYHVLYKKFYVYLLKESTNQMFIFLLYKRVI